jgi:hypothetical protein
MIQIKQIMQRFVRFFGLLVVAATAVQYILDPSSPDIWGNKRNPLNQYFAKFAWVSCHECIDGLKERHGHPSQRFR